MIYSPPVASAAPLYSAGPGLRGAHSAVAARGGVSTEHLHAESGHARLLLSGCAGSEDAGPGYPSSPGAPRLQKRGPAGQTDHPQRVPRILHLAVAGAEGLRKIPGPQPPTKAHPALAVRGPDGELRTPRGDHPAGADYRRFDQLIAKSFTQITNRSCDSVTDFLAYPKEKGGLGLLMPGFFHKELRRVWASLTSTRGRKTRWTCPWRGRPCGRSRRTSTASSRARTSCPTEQRRTVSRCAAC